MTNLSILNEFKDLFTIKPSNLSNVHTSLTRNFLDDAQYHEDKQNALEAYKQGN